jgi:hypothetical protein
MHIAKTFAVATALLGAGTVSASPLTAFEDFESVSPKDTPLASLVTLVGTFTPSAGVPFANVWVASPGYTNFGAGNNPTTSSILVANGDEEWVLELAFAADRFAVDLYLNDLGPATISFFDAADVLIASFTYAADADSSNNFIQLDYVSPTPIVTATWTSTLGGTLNTGWDNVFIAQDGAIPEPASWALLIAGFGLVGTTLRRKTQQTA